MSIVPNLDHVATLPVDVDLVANRRAARGIGGSRLFWRAKSLADMAGALLLLPAVALLGAVLLVLNPIFNPGPLFYRQSRMGQGFSTFTALKFRTMREAGCERGAHDPVEADRIPPMGRLLRRMGLDELPQAINILRGEMSLIGPRPDCLHHAEVFLDEIPDYARRFAVRPGLSGLAQIKVGYAVGTQQTRAKVRADLVYLERASFQMDAWIVWRTIITILAGRGD